MIIKLLMVMLVPWNNIILIVLEELAIPMMLTALLCLQERPTDSLIFWLAFV